MKNKPIWQQTKLVNLLAILLSIGVGFTVRAANRTWTGGGADGNWSTAANWGGTAPAGGDVLIFSGTTQLSNTNDMLGLSIGGLRFVNGDFNLYGNPVTLTTSASGLVTNLAGINRIYFGFTSLQANKQWLVASGSEVVLAGPLASTTTSGGIVMLDGGGTVRFTGNVTAVRGIDGTNGTVIVDGGVVDHSNDGFRFKARSGHTMVAHLTNNATWRWGGGANFRLGNTAAAGTCRMEMTSGTLELYGSAVSIFVGDTAVAGATNIFNQKGGTVLSTGSGNNDLVMGTTGGAECVYNLDGGTLHIRRVRANAAGQGVFNFNGGTLMAKVNDAVFMDALGAAYVKAGGAIIDSSSNNITINQTLFGDFVSTGGGLTKLGSGALTLTGGETYTGPTKVGSGTLALGAAGYPTTSDLTLSNGAALNLDVAGGSSSLTAPNVTLDDNSSLSFSYGAMGGNPFAPAINATTLSARGTNISIRLQGSGFVAGQFALLKYSGAIGGNGYGAFTLADLPPGVLGKLTNNTASGSIDLLITLVVNALTWNGNVSGDWDINTTANWRDPLAVAAKYKEYGTTDIVGDIVTFDDTLLNDGINPPNTNINLSAALSPAILTVYNNAYGYRFGGAGRISGSSTLIKDGLFPLTLATANDFSGGTFLTNGAVRLGNDLALGSGPVYLRGGTLSSDGSTSRTLTNLLALSPGAFAPSVLGDLVDNGLLTFNGGLDQGGNNAVDVTVNSDVVVSGNIGNGGIDQKYGPGTLTFSGFDGEMHGSAGGNMQIEAGNVAMDHGTYRKGVGGVRIMNLVPSGLSIFTVGTGGLLLMEGPGQNIRVGSGSPAGDPTATNVLNLSGTLAWTTNAGSFGQIQMGNSCAFAQVNLNVGGLLRPGSIVHNANVTEFNANGGTLAGTFSTATYMQGLTVANLLAGGLTVTTEGLLGEGLALTIGQTLQGIGGLTKDGVGTLTLSGSNSYSGLTAVRQGTLLLGPAYAATGGVLVTNDAVLGLLSDGPGVSTSISSAALGDGVTAGGLLAAFTGQSGNPSQAAGTIADLALNGNVPVSVQLGGISVGTIPLIHYVNLTGSGSITTGDLPQGVAGTVQVNSTTKTIELVVSSVAPLVWSGNVTNLWDVGVSTSWSLLGNPAVFKDGDNVRFDDSAVNPVILMTTVVSPGNVLVSNQAVPLSFVASGGSIAGNANFVKDGTGTVTVGGANSFSGDVIIKSGMLELDNVNALGSTVGATYVSNGASLNMKNIRLAGNVEVIQIEGQGFNNLGALYSDTGVGNADFLRDLRLSGDAWIGAGTGVRFGYSDVAGTVTCVGGLHKLTKVGQGQFDLEEATVTVGEIEVLEGILQSANASVINGGFGITVRSNAEFRIYQLAATLPRPFTLDQGRINCTGWTGVPTENNLDGDITLQTAGTFQVGGGFTITANAVVKGAGDLTKTGGGTLLLAGANTYSGQTILSAGTLQLGISGSIAASPVIQVNAGTLDVSQASPWSLAASQELRGNGTISGSVTAAGTVSPGASIGGLSFNNDLILAGTNVMELTREGSLTNDVINVAGNLTYGGVLRLALSGATPLVVNDTFKLFNFASLSVSTFSQVIPPDGYTIDATQLGVDGSVRITSVPTTQEPPTLSLVQSGNSLEFSWTDAAYRLQAQTNNLATGLAGNWVDFPGGSASPVTVTVDPSNGTVFFRLTK